VLCVIFTTFTHTTKAERRAELGWRQSADGKKIRRCIEGEETGRFGGHSTHHEQALVCLCYKLILDASRRQPFHRKMAKNRVFSYRVALIYLAFWLPSIMTAIG